MVEVATMDELMAVHVHSNNLATFPDPEATPELIAKVEEIKDNYGLRELRQRCGESRKRLRSPILTPRPSWAPTLG